MVSSGMYMNNNINAKKNRFWFFKFFNFFKAERTFKKFNSIANLLKSNVKFNIMFDISVSWWSAFNGVINRIISSIFQWSMELHTILGMLWQFTSYNEHTLRLYFIAADTYTIQSNLFDDCGYTGFISDTSSHQSGSTDHESGDRKETNQVWFESIFLCVVLLWL